MFSIKLNTYDGLDIANSYTFISMNNCWRGNLSRYYIYDGQYPQGLNLKTIKSYLTAKNYPTTPINWNQNIANAFNNPSSTEATRIRNEYLWLVGSLESQCGLVFGNTTNANTVNIFLVTHEEGSTTTGGNAFPNQPITSSTTDEGGQVITTPVDNYFFMFDREYINGVLSDGTGYGGVATSTSIQVEYFDGLDGVTPQYYTDKKQDFTGVVSFQGDASEAFAIVFGQATIRLCPNLYSGYNRINFAPIEFLKSAFEYIPDPNENGGESGDDGGGGGTIGGGDEVDFSGLPPNKLLASGIIKMYNPTDAQMRDFTNFIYSSADDVITNFKKIWVNPMESIISYSIVPFLVPHEQVNRHMYFCGVDSEVSAPLLTSQYLQHDCGYVDVPEESKSILDYTNFTKAKLFLPFIGIVDIDVDDCMGGRISVQYNIDLLTGDCVAEVKCRKSTRIYGEDNIINHNSVLYTFKGNCVVENPLTGNNFQQLYGSVLNGIRAVALPTPASVAGLGSEIMGQKVSVQRSGSVSGNACLLSNYVPYIILERAIRNTPSEFAQRRGYPSNRLMQLKNVEGYTLVDIDSMQFTSVDEQMTDNELQEIKQMLSEGVYL